jgi:hypothetical protein
MNKIITATTALLFVFTGVTFAHDWNHRKHKPHGKAYGHHYKAHKHHKSHKHHPGWKKYRHAKRHRHYGKRYAQKAVHHHYYYEKHRRRQAPREDVIYKVGLKEPNLVFKIIVWSKEAPMCWSAGGTWGANR